MHEIFGEDGHLRGLYSNFEFRQEQLEMSEFILETLTSGENGLVEAGTGVGKTLAYLVPALVYSLENNKILAISTETKTLQKQLIDKDVPLVQLIINRYLERDFSYSLCLGSQNYPCRKRYELLLSNGRFPKEEINAVQEVKGRFSDSEIFTRFDIDLSNILWNEISRETEVCNPYNCPFSSMCVFQRAKRKWSKTNLLIMNHYLFFSNIALGKCYLPNIDIVIFDEAQSIEEIASDQLGFKVSYNQIVDTVNRLYRENRKNSILLRISDESKRKKAIKSMRVIISELSSFFENLRELFNTSNTVRIREGLPFGDTLAKALREFMLLITGIEDDLEDDSSRMEFDIIRGRLFVFQQNLESLLYQLNSNFVYWIERRGDEMLGDIHIKGEPVSVAEIIYDEVNSFYDSSLFVSATLANRDDFSFIADRLGIYEYRSLLLSSPFDYKRQVVLYLGEETAPPNDPSFIDQASIISAEIINHLEGNCLILFTSYRMLGEVRERLTELVDFPIYAQGDFPATEAIVQYIEDDGSILMGTHSFWQGIDLPGDLLRGVILMRLPFNVPDRPMIQARIEKIEEQGLNSFYNYQVPNAIIRFKQGFGRLIRSRNDKGLIAVLDSRILTKSYGNLFLSSLPECNIVQTMKDLKSSLQGIGVVINGIAK
ncbi:MAG: ATP-dependent DNA helicase [Spirochaetota bacterium]|nr:ATP-dependent DNA helicase [Spirochaetota bacterium]